MLAPQLPSQGGLFFGVDCSIFSLPRQPATIALSVLVVVEMFNALNAISETDSLLTFGPWKNPLLIAAIALSLALHYAICTIPFCKIGSKSPASQQKRSRRWFGSVPP